MPVCWGITDGKAGTKSQVQALAIALGLHPEMKKFPLKRPWCWLPNSMYTGSLKNFVIPYFLDSRRDSMAAPWPEVVISCGRRAAIAAMGLKAHLIKQKVHADFIHVQDPMVEPENFDLIVAMAHDTIEGKNVVKTPFALHSITKASLDEAARRYDHTFSHFPAPRVTVLLGGSTNKYTLTQEGMARILAVLKRMLDNTNYSLLITPSRRTGSTNIEMLTKTFADNKRVYIYDQVVENPYLGMLALADALLVTNDSVNMMSEAYASGKPIYILPLPDHEGTKPAKFADMLIKAQIARPLSPTIESWKYASGNEMEKLVAEIRRRLPNL